MLSAYWGTPLPSGGGVTFPQGLLSNGPFHEPGDRMLDQTRVHTHLGLPLLPGRAHGPIPQPFPLQTSTTDCRVLHAETLDLCPNYCCQMKDRLPRES